MNTHFKGKKEEQGIVLIKFGSLEMRKLVNF
jgi:hypothetical protein